MAIGVPAPIYALVFGRHLKRTSTSKEWAAVKEPEATARKVILRMLYVVWVYVTAWGAGMGKAGMPDGFRFGCVRPGNRCRAP